MATLYININKSLLLLFCFLILFSTYVLDTHAEDALGRVVEKENNDLHLRGEIWYGDASWYGPRFHGKKTSSGERFNKNKLTAAHKHLPFNTKVLVTNLKNNKSVVVRINDRGPFIGDRIIDLSEEAMERIDAKKEGVAYIKLQVLTPLVENYQISSL